MNCNACGHNNRLEARFCSACGDILERVCFACDEVVEASSLFCDRCGADLSKDPANLTQDDYAPTPRAADPFGATNSNKGKPTFPSDAERRHLTVMFCDLVNSTGLSEQLDPEDMRNLLASYQTRCRNAIERFGGHIARYVGDGLLVYFGYPVAYEDAAARAVHAGLEVVNAINSLDHESNSLSINLSVRIGINTGNVVVGDIGTGDEREQMAVVGDVPNIAARLQSSAEPGAVVIGESTQRLVKDIFKLKSLGDQLHKGVSKPVGTFRVIGTISNLHRLHTANQISPNQFVGRDAEIKLLHDRWEQMKEGESQLLLLIGEAGIGKSRILQRFRDDLRNQKHQRYYYYCSSHHQSSAFYPIISGVEHELGFEVNDSNDKKLKKIESYLLSQKLSLDDHVPIFSFLLGVSAKEQYPALELNPQQLKQKVFSTLIDQYCKVARKAPLLMVFEDLHWADPSTLELLNIWIQQFTDRPCFLILTFRPDFEFPWKKQTNFTSLSLNRLSRKGCTTIINDICGGKRLSGQVVEEIIARTDGVPLYLEELTKMLLESNLLNETTDAYELSGPLSQLAIPESLQDSLMARLDKVDSMKEVAQFASAIGRRFSHKLLAAATGLAETDLEKSIQNLLDAELIVKRAITPEIEYEFKHALVQETAYHSLLKSSRQHYHQRIAQLLESQFSDNVENRPELLAHHYTEAQFVDQAVTQWLRAGQNAISRSANLEAIDHIEKGLEVLALTPDTLDRAKRELELQIALAVPKTSVKGYAASEVQQTYSRARELCMQIGQTPQLFPAIYGMWRYYLLRAEYSTAQELSEQLIDIAEHSKDPAFLTAAPRSAGGTLFYQGRLVEARHSLDRVIVSEPSDKDRSRALLFDVVDALVASHSYNAWILWLQGYPDQARQQSEKAVNVANSLNHQFSIALANSFASWTYQFCGDKQRTNEIAASALELSQKYGFKFWVGWAKILQGYATLKEQSETSRLQASELMKKGLHEWRGTGSKLGQTYFLTLLAEVTASEDEYENSLVLLDEAINFSRHTGERFWLAEIYRVKGEILLEYLMDKEKEAEVLFCKAREIAVDQLSKSLELRATMSLYRLYKAQRSTTHIRRTYALLNDVYSFFSEGFDTENLVEAKWMLEKSTVIL